MAYKNKLLINSKTGQAIRFIQTSADTGGELLEMETTFRPHSKEPPPHYHPSQVEDFFIKAGELTVRIDGKVVTYQQGDSFHVAMNKVHSMWNGSSVTTVLNWRVRPALNTENLFETVSGLSNDGRTNEDGVPGLLQLVPLVDKFSNVYRAAKPPYYVQKVLFVILAPLSYLLGYRALYKKYLD